MAEMKNGMVQFTDDHGSIITTSMVGLTVNRMKDGRNVTFYGSKGRAILHDDEYASVIKAMGFDEPDTDDLTMPA